MFLLVCSACILSQMLGFQSEKCIGTKILASYLISLGGSVFFSSVSM